MLNYEYKFCQDSEAQINTIFQVIGWFQSHGTSYPHHMDLSVWKCFLYTDDEINLDI